MRLLSDENVRSSHVSALEASGHDVERVVDFLGVGVSDGEVLAAARESGRAVLTYDRRDFAHLAEHAGVLLADETMAPREVRLAVERIERLYPELNDVVEYLSDWC